MLIDLNDLRMSVYQFLNFPSCLCNNINYIDITYIRFEIL